MSLLLDTNVVSEVRKRSPNPRVARWFASVPADTLFISVLVFGELRQGVDLLVRRDPVQAEVLRQKLEQLDSVFADRIVPITREVAEAWGRLNAAHRPPDIDGLMAATALVHGWTFVTRNTRHVEATGVRLLNPFAA